MNAAGPPVSAADSIRSVQQDDAYLQTKDGKRFLCWTVLRDSCILHGFYLNPARWFSFSFFRAQLALRYPVALYCCWIEFL